MHLAGKKIHTMVTKDVPLIISPQGQFTKLNSTFKLTLIQLQNYDVTEEQFYQLI